MTLSAHHNFMERCNGFLGSDDWNNGTVYECETCGNHVCMRCAVACRDVCPNCFGRLLRLS